jgi:hypothetical protein
MALWLPLFRFRGLPPRIQGPGWRHQVMHALVPLLFPFKW